MNKQLAIFLLSILLTSCAVLDFVGEVAEVIEPPKEVCIRTECSTCH